VTRIRGQVRQTRTLEASPGEIIFRGSRCICPWMGRALLGTTPRTCGARAARPLIEANSGWGSALLGFAGVGGGVGMFRYDVVWSGMGWYGEESFDGITELTEGEGFVRRTRSSRRERQGSLGRINRIGGKAGRRRGVAPLRGGGLMRGRFMARLYRIWEKGGIARKLRWLALLKIFGSPLKTPAEGSKGGVF
jgi:hypothetical protein